MNNDVPLVVDVDVEIDTGGRRRMVVIVPVTRMMVVLVVVMFFVAACQRQGHDAGEEGCAEQVFYLVFHNRRLYVS